MTAEDDGTNEIIIYSGPDGKTRVQMRFTGRDVWMTQAQMAELFDVDVRTVNEHLGNVYSDDELEPGATIRDFRIVRLEGGRSVGREIKHYNLDAIISVGYRVKSKPATRFRQWATRVLTEFAVKGHVVDVERLRDPEASDYFQELLEKIRDIRSSERNVWMRVLELASLCNDYDAEDRARLNAFYAGFQNTVHWGVMRMTAAEIIAERVDADKPFCGVEHFSGDQPTTADAHVAKNYYGEPELRELNLLTVRLLDFFEDQTNRRLVVALDQFTAKLQEFMRFDSRPVLKDRGSISMDDAKAKASAEMKVYKARIRAEKEAAGARMLSELGGTAKAIEKARTPRRPKKPPGKPD